MQLRFLAKSNAVLVHVHVSGNALRKNYALRKKLVVVVVEIVVCFFFTKSNTLKKNLRCVMKVHNKHF